MEDSAFPKTLSPRSALCCSTSSYMAPTALMIFQWSPAFQTLYIYGSVFLMLHGKSPKEGAFVGRALQAIRLLRTASRRDT
jgi:hypothetical protein